MSHANHAGPPLSGSVPNASIQIFGHGIRKGRPLIPGRFFPWCAVSIGVTKRFVAPPTSLLQFSGNLFAKPGQLSPGRSFFGRITRWVIFTLPPLSRLRDSPVPNSCHRDTHAVLHDAV